MQRFFPTAVLATGGPMSLVGCKSFDNWFFQLERGIKDRVLIVGGGIAGLNLAFELKKKGIPFQILEGSARLGGRIYSLEHFNASEQKAELGAEWFSDSDQNLKNLAKELKIELQVDRRIASDQFFFTGDQWIPQARLEKEIQILYQQLAKIGLQKSDRELDLMPLSNLFKLMNPTTTKVSDVALMWLERVVQKRWGADPVEISGLFIMRWLDVIGPKPLRTLAQSNTRVTGGSSVLINALHDRLVGILPQEVLRLKHELIQVSYPTADPKGPVELTFQSPQGQFQVQTMDAVLCLPMAKLRLVKGLTSESFSGPLSAPISQLGLGRTSKIVASYKQKFWRQRLNFLMGLGTLSAQSIWDATPEGSDSLKATRGLISIQMGGQHSFQINPNSANVILNEFQSGIGDQEKQQPENIHVHNWTTYPWTQGSNFFFRPGQFLKWSKLDWNPLPDGSLRIAGDFLDPMAGGRLEASLQSSISVAQLIYEKRQILKKKSTGSV